MSDGRIGAVVLAAGASRRMGSLNKLLLDVDGQPCVRRVVQAALNAGLAPVVAVVGHDGERIAAALADLPVTIRHNADHALGMGGSVAEGVAALPPGLTGAAILLGDMPLVTADDLRDLAAGLTPETAACVPAYRGRRGNPVLWSSRYFPRLRALSGDRGARGLLAELGGAVREVPVAGEGVLVDVDTAEAAADLRARLTRTGPEPDPLA